MKTARTSFTNEVQQTWDDALQGKEYAAAPMALDQPTTYLQSLPQMG